MDSENGIHTDSEWAGRTLSGDPVQRVKFAIETIVEACGIDADVSVREDDDTIYAEIVGAESEDFGRLIGRRAATLDAIQVISHMIAGRGLEPGSRKRVVVDANGYRQERERTLIAEALRVADAVVAEGNTIELEAMTAQERRAVHTALVDVAGVDTHSVGDDPDRRIVVSPVVGE